MMAVDSALNSPERPRTRWQRTGHVLALLFIYYLAAAASFSGYFAKWAFRDDNPSLRSVRMFDGTAERPFIFRQLLPVVADTLVAVGEKLPGRQMLADAVQAMGADGAFQAPDAIYARARDLQEPALRSRYIALYHLTFLSYFLACLAMRWMCLQFGLSLAASTLAPLLFALIYPLLLTRGGYYYDAPELAFLCVSAVWALQGRWVFLMLLTIPATLNKEAFLLYLPTLYPLLRKELSQRNVALALGAAMFISLAINVALKYEFQASEGANAVYQLRRHIGFFLDWRPYFRMETNYGVPTAAGVHVLHIGILLGLVRSSWQRLPGLLQRHAILAIVLNLPLFFLFAYKDELRNLSLLFPTLVIAMAVWISNGLSASNEASAAR